MAKAQSVDTSYKSKGGATQRGFINVAGVKVDPNRNTLMEHPNRGKRSVGIDISTQEGKELIYEIAQTADVFLTNYLPAARQKLGIDVSLLSTCWWAAGAGLAPEAADLFGTMGARAKSAGSCQ